MNFKDLLIATFLFLLGATFATSMYFIVGVKDHFQDIQETIIEYCDLIDGKLILDQTQNYYCVPPDWVKK